MMLNETECYYQSAVGNAMRVNGATRPPASLQSLWEAVCPDEAPENKTGYAERLEIIYEN